ncbi:N-acetylmuramoyl-L-alanine amidase family protein [Roseibacillus persicicus]|uniref:MurNAc-LAA domain-containing protein n=1 Tax=Roseibacillus persicicus TaxID=454148 RepID=A0A918WMG9_9BACT|nr:N-acetylmuramoyl-L-alanine amidase [Roseibacillus persicicus]GHC63875.1 hypothetical protein GCM10007100_34330 [Roseibacillus persicicus]
MRRYFPLLLALALFVAGLIFFLLPKDTPTPPAPTPPPTLPTGPALSSLAETPDWSALETIDNQLSSTEFMSDLVGIFALPNSWQSSIKVEDESVVVRHHHGPDGGFTRLPFPEQPQEPNSLPPLDQMHIAIDPGHIGGDYAVLEQRNFAPFGDDPDQMPVREGELALATALHLKPLLEEMGAKVTLVRETNEPVTQSRPEDFLPDFPDRLMAEKIFYRTAEIRARGELVNEVIQPDLVLCLHYNAEAWNDEENPWAERNHFHVLLHGAYMAEELALDDQRFEMMRHLLNRTTRRALPLAQTISDVFLRDTGLVPFQYTPAAPAIQVDATRPIFARNLLANRIYEAPTIFLEPYVMNHREVYDRVQLGDYEGFREIDGVKRRSLVREYAQAVANGFTEFYTNPPH